MALEPDDTVRLCGWETILREVDWIGLAWSLVGLGPVGDVGDVGDEQADAKTRETAPHSTKNRRTVPERKFKSRSGEVCNRRRVQPRVKL